MLLSFQSTFINTTHISAIFSFFHNDETSSERSLELVFSIAKKIESIVSLIFSFVIRIHSPLFIVPTFDRIHSFPSFSRINESLSLGKESCLSISITIFFIFSGGVLLFIITSFISPFGIYSLNISMIVPISSLLKTTTQSVFFIYFSSPLTSRFP